MAGTFLNIGCGDRHLEGFLNVDLEGSADFILDVTKGLPFPDHSVQGLYSEHFIEHISQQEALRFFRECRRILAPGGRIRIATPDLTELAKDYLGNTRDEAMLEEFGLDFVANSCELFNVSMRWWGHQWLYDEAELRRLGESAGLNGLERCKKGASDWVEFQGLEWRKESHLIIEFEAPRLEEKPKDDPRVTVAIPAYNPRYYAASLQSVVDQDVQDMEILICDDSSGSEIEEITRRFAANDPRVTYVRNENNLGDYGNYLNCFERARGRYLKILNDDDVLAPASIAVMAKLLDEEPSVSLVTSYRQRIDAQGTVLPDDLVTQPLTTQDSLIEGASLAHHVMSVQMNVIGEPSCALFRRKDLVDQVPDFMAFAGRRSNYNVDVGMWLTLLSRGDAVYLTAPLCQWRIHPDQAQKAVGAKKRGLEAWAKHREDSARWGLFKPGRKRSLLTVPLAKLEKHRRDGGWGAVIFGSRLKRGLYDPVLHHETCRVFEAGETGRALALAQTELEAYPLAPLLWNDFGAMNFASGQVDQAGQAIGKALELDPGHPGAMLNHASLCAEFGDMAGYKDSLKAVASSPRASIDDLLEAADKLEALEEILDSVSALQRIMELEPTNGKVRSRLDRWIKSLNREVTS